MMLQKCVTTGAFRVVPPRGDPQGAPEDCFKTNFAATFRQDRNSFAARSQQDRNRIAITSQHRVAPFVAISVALRRYLITA